jgi:glucose uptake protein GlcU
MLFNLNTITLNVVVIGFVAGFCGGLGLPFLYQAIATCAVSFVAPVVALTQSTVLILFATIIKGESLSASFPIAALLGGIGIYLCSRTASGNQKITAASFFLAIATATFFSGFSFLVTEIESSQILGALFGARIGVFS